MTRRFYELVKAERTLAVLEKAATRSEELVSRPIEAGYHLVEVTGVLRLANDGEKGLFFVIPEGEARVVERILG